MTLHNTHNHGRVLRGADARKHLEMHKRDSHGSDIKLHVPEGFAQKQGDDTDTGNVATVVNVVYVTASADFTGTTAGYTTVTGTSEPTSTAAASSASTQAVSSDDSAATTTSAPSASSSSAHSSTIPTATPSSTTDSLDTSSLLIASSTSPSSSSSIDNKSMFLNPPASATFAATSTYGAAAVAGTPVAATHSASAEIGNTNAGMSGGAKAGLAFGIIAAFALVGGLIFFCWRRRKNPNNHEELNEKRTSSIFGGKAPDRSSVVSEKVAPSVRSSRTASTAPRLSLRPVTQFLPNLNENRKSGGNLLGIGGAAPMSEKPKSMWERRPVGTDNPFDDNAEKQTRSASPPAANPFDEPEGAVLANASRTSLNSNSSSDGGKSASSQSSAPSAAGKDRAAVPTGPQGPNNVHRVQLDFKPSMEDELELKSGQLVRMLHEYDDGWALCVRMDRSQQGVAPRTCLSKVPVKPRPQGPPNGRQGPPPPGATRGPAPGRQGPGMVPRPLTPGREQSGSADGGRPQTPVGNAAPAVARKPVPGQAL